MKIPIVACTTCGREDLKDVPSKEIIEEELLQLGFQEATLLRLLAKCRKSQEERKQILAALPKEL